MNDFHAEKFCSQRSEVAAYIDGELSPSEEIALETHLASCAECRAELNEQKKLLCILDFALEDEKKFELPENFTAVVVANAESKVSGLRRPQERFTAFFVCAALFLLVILGLGSESEAVFKTFADFGEQFLAVAGFAFRFFYDIALGLAIILRSISSHLFSGSAAAIIFIVILFAVSLLALLRFFNRSTELKIQIQEK